MLRYWHVNTCPVWRERRQLVSASDAFDRPREREAVPHSAQCVDSREKEHERDKEQEKHGSNEGGSSSSSREDIRYVSCFKKNIDMAEGFKLKNKIHKQYVVQWYIYIFVI